MKWALLNITVGVLCLVGWASVLTFSILRLTGVLEVSSEAERAITLGLFPFALGFPLGTEMIERGAKELAPGLTTVIGAVLIWALTFPTLERITGWIAGTTDRLTEKGTTP